MHLQINRIYLDAHVLFGCLWDTLPYLISIAFIVFQNPNLSLLSHLCSSISKDAMEITHIHVRNVACNKIEGYSNWPILQKFVCTFLMFVVCYNTRFKTMAHFTFRYKLSLDLLMHLTFFHSRFYLECKNLKTVNPSFPNSCFVGNAEGFWTHRSETKNPTMKISFRNKLTKIEIYTYFIRKNSKVKL